MSMSRQWSCSWPRGVLRRVLSLPFLYVLMVALALLTAGCGSSRIPSGAESSVTPSGVEPVLRQELNRWRGTPHVLGGTTADGMDCSAFVQRVFTDAFEVNLPRTTEDQVRVGRQVRRSDLQPGDLVFFRPPTKSRHVGIYLSNGEFAHVSSSQGVTVSEMSMPYWRRAYWTSRRVLGGDEHIFEAEPLGAPAPVPAATRRVGW